MALPLSLYGIFALVSTLGAFLIIDHFSTRKAAVWTSMAVLLFFLVLLSALIWMIRASGLEA